MSSRWDLGWSKRAHEDGTPYFVVSFPSGSATVKKNPRGLWNAHITLRNGDNRHSIGMDDEFAAMTWAQDKIHEMTTQKVESSTSCKRTFTVKPKSIQAGIGTGRRDVWYFCQYPDRTPVHIDGYRCRFDNEADAQAVLDEIMSEEYYQNRYPGLRVEHKFEYSVWHD